MRIFIVKSNEQFESDLEDSILDLSISFPKEEVTFKAGDIAPGASLTAIVAELKDVLVIGGPVMLFFAGKKIEENIDSWIKIIERAKALIARLRKHKKNWTIVVDNWTAAAIALSHLHESEHSAHCRLVRILGINPYIQDIIDCLEHPIREQQASTYVSYLCLFELDQLRYYEVLVSASGKIIRCSCLAPITENHIESSNPAADSGEDH